MFPITGYYEQTNNDNDVKSTHIPSLLSRLPTIFNNPLCTHVKTFLAVIDNCSLDKISDFFPDNYMKHARFFFLASSVLYFLRLSSILVLPMILQRNSILTFHKHFFLRQPIPCCPFGYPC